MVTAKNAGFSTASQQRVEQGAQQTALGEALAQATDWARQALTMQQSLLAGLARSQQLEAKRLAALYSADDERVASALARGERYAGMQSEILDRATQIGHVVDTFQKDGLFTGYVLQTDGTPAVGYVVLLRISSVVNRKGATGGKATTDATGWFSIDTGIAAPAPPPTPPVGTAPGNGVVDKPILVHVERLVDRLMGELADHQVAAPAPPPTSGPPPVANPPPGNDGLGTDVTIFDPTGRAVLEDPIPPTFAETTSEFRVYTLFSQSGLKNATIRRKG